MKKPECPLSILGPNHGEQPSVKRLSKVELYGFLDQMVEKVFLPFLLKYGFSSGNHSA